MTISLHSLVLPPLTILILAVLVSFTDRTYTAVKAKDYLRALCYGLVAFFALVSLLAPLFPGH